MDRCGNCGSSGSGAFCAACGFRMGDSHEKLLVLGADHAESQAESQAVSSGSLRRTALILAALAAILFLGVAAVFGGPESRSAIAEGDGVSGAQQPPASETDDEPDEVAVNDGAADEPDLPATKPSTAIRSTTTTSQAEVLAEGEYWLGEPIAWYALLPGPEGLIRIDLNTGEAVNLGLDLRPMVATDRFVVLRDSSGSLYALPPSEFAAPFEDEVEPISAELFQSFERASVSSNPERVWLSGDYNEGPVVEVDLLTGEELRYRGPTVQREHLFRTNAMTPRFRSPISGGVFEMQSDGSLRRVRDSGFVVAEGYGRMMVTDCDETLDCRSEWFDSDSLEAIPGLFGAPESSNYFSGITARGRLVALDQPTGFFDIETGDIIKISSAELKLYYQDRLTVSPDTSVVASATSARATFRATESTDSVSVEGVRLFGGTSIVFIPRAEVEAAGAE